MTFISTGCTTALSVFYGPARSSSLFFANTALRRGWKLVFRRTRHRINIDRNISPSTHVALSSSALSVSPRYGIFAQSRSRTLGHSLRRVDSRPLMNPAFLARRSREISGFKRDTWRTNSPIRPLYRLIVHRLLRAAYKLDILSFREAKRRSSNSCELLRFKHAIRQEGKHAVHNLRQTDVVRQASLVTCLNSCGVRGSEGPRLANSNFRSDGNKVMSRPRWSVERHSESQHKSTAAVEYRMPRRTQETVIVTH